VAFYVSFSTNILRIILVETLREVSSRSIHNVLAFDVLVLNFVGSSRIFVDTDEHNVTNDKMTAVLTNWLRP
jgi:hypothetical protein